MVIYMIIVEYMNNRELVKIICKKYGIFTQSPINHFAGKCCPICKFSHGEIIIYVYLNKH